MNILIIDDSAMARAMLGDMFEAEGADVSLAASGEEGVNKAAEEKADIVVVDNVLPDTNGLEVCRRIRASEGAGIRIVLMTGSIEKVDVAEAEEAGANACVAKTPDFGLIRAAALDNG